MYYFSLLIEGYHNRIDTLYNCYTNYLIIATDLPNSLSLIVAKKYDLSRKLFYVYQIIHRDIFVVVFHSFFF
jgi:hypothetical protein